MLRKLQLPLILFGCLLAGACDRKSSPEPSSRSTTAPSALSRYDWRPMFDGKTLGKWKASDFAGAGEVTIKDGAIVMAHGNGDMTGITWTGEYPKVNYEIALEAQRVEGSDFFCGLTFPVNDTFASLILGGWGGSVCGISCLNYEDASRNETTTTRQFKTGQWYRVRMRVSGEKFPVTLCHHANLPCPP